MINGKINFICNNSNLNVLELLQSAIERKQIGKLTIEQNSVNKKVIVLNLN